MAANIRPGRWHGELRTGRLRPAKVGTQSQVSEVVVKTWTEDGATTLPRISAQVKTTKDTAWYSVEQLGTYNVDASVIEGNGTLLSHIVAASAVTGVGPYALNVNPRKVRLYEDATLLTGWTYSGWDVTLDSGKSGGTVLYAYWNGSPQQVGAVGDLMHLSVTGRVAIIDAVRDHDNGTVEWGTESDAESATLIPAKGIKAGDDEIVLGTPREVDSLEIRILVAPQDSSST